MKIPTPEQRAHLIIEAMKDMGDGHMKDLQVMIADTIREAVEAEMKQWPEKQMSLALEESDKRAEEQRKNLERVTSAIGIDVLAFCRGRGVDAEFHAAELHEYVGSHIAPASADRILRNLRQCGHVDYVIINRRASLYQITAMNAGQAPAP